MKLKTALAVGVSFFFAALWASAQAPQPAPETPIPAATSSEIECGGFITGGSVAADTYVIDGADNDFRAPYHTFKPGDLVFLRSGSKERAAVGTEYRLVRPGTEPLLASWLNSSLSPVREFGHGDWYPDQVWSMRSLGKAYEDVGRVKVTQLTAEGAIAEVTFACGTVEINDIAIPYQPREIPTYTPSRTVERFPLPEGKLWGALTAAPDNHGLFGVGRRVYINLGESDGVHAGQRFKIFHVDRDLREGYFHAVRSIPTEVVGELVVLSTQEKASLAIIVSGTREISLGDGVVSVE